MHGSGAENHEGLKQRAMAELKAFWLIALYLWMFLGAFTAYRSLILAETGVVYVKFGIAFVESLIIAKVVLIGQMLSVSRRYESHALYLSVLYKSLLFGLLVIVFAVIEHVVTGLVHGKGWAGGIEEMKAVGAYELAARVLMLVVAFVPFFAFWELGRVLGMDRLAQIFFGKPSPPAGG